MLAEKERIEFYENGIIEFEKLHDEVLGRIRKEIDKYTSILSKKILIRDINKYFIMMATHNSQTIDGIFSPSLVYCGEISSDDLNVINSLNRYIRVDISDIDFDHLIRIERLNEVDLIINYTNGFSRVIYDILLSSEEYRIKHTKTELDNTINLFTTLKSNLKNATREDIFMARRLEEDIYNLNNKISSLKIILNKRKDK